MTELTDVASVEAFIRGNGMILLEVGSAACAPCAGIRSKIERWAQQHGQVSIAYVELERVPAVASLLQVLSAPAILVYVDGALCIREAGCFSLQEVFARMERYLQLME